MVFITPLLGAAALLSGFAAGLPRPDSAINEPAVSAPNGTPITDTSSPQATAVSSSTMMSSSSSSGSNYGSSGSSGSNWGSSSSSYGSSGSSSWSGSSSSGNYGSSSGSGSSWGSSSGSSSPSYGSGSSNWGNQGYNDCVQQCVANYGGLPSPYTPTATSTNSGGSSGSGVTHTIIVAPSQGVLRYVPFATNASVGDTIKFMWGANNHTVTKSSELTPCNHTSDSPFTSGVQLKDFVFTQVVNDTNPTFFYCGVPNHCQKGMFGIINPPNALTASTSVMNMMPSLAAGSSDMAAMASYTNTQVGGNSMVSNWGNSIDMASLPEWSHQYIAENVMYTKTFLASNPEVLQKDGSIDLSASGTTPLMIPQDLSAALNSATPASSSVASDPASTAAASSASASSSAAANQNVKSGALSMSPSKVAVGVIAAFASFMML